MGWGWLLDVVCNGMDAGAGTHHTQSRQGDLRSGWTDGQLVASEQLRALVEVITGQRARGGEMEKANTSTKLNTLARQNFIQATAGGSSASHRLTRLLLIHS